MIKKNIDYVIGGIIILCMVSALMYVAYKKRDCHYVTDNNKRSLIFESCLKNIPEGPKNTTFNDWNEVVNSCNQIAKEQSTEYNCE